MLETIQISWIKEFFKIKAELNNFNNNFNSNSSSKYNSRELLETDLMAGGHHLPQIKILPITASGVQVVLTEEVLKLAAVWLTQRKEEHLLQDK